MSADQIPAEVREVADRIEESFPLDDWAARGYLAGVAAGRKQAAAEALMAARDDLDRTADRLRAKARETGDKTHFGTAVGVSLACFRLVELADRATRAEGGEPNA